jgi:mono/diheme cytochrome c family protein
MIKTTESAFQPTSRIALIAGLFLVRGLVASAAPQQQTAAAVSPQRALVNQYCLGCHNEKLKTGGLELNTVNVDHVEQSPEVWEKVLR